MRVKFLLSKCKRGTPHNAALTVRTPRPPSPHTAAMSLSNDLDRKFFHALLNGLTQGFIYGKADITLAYLQEQLFGSSSMKPAGAALTRDKVHVSPTACSA